MKSAVFTRYFKRTQNIDETSNIYKMENDTKILAENIEKLSSRADKLNSLGWSFLRGVLFGLGSAIGASIVAAIFVGALNWFFSSFEHMPIIRNMEDVRLKK